MIDNCLKYAVYQARIEFSIHVNGALNTLPLHN